MLVNFIWLLVIYANFQDRGGVKMAEPEQHSDDKKPYFSNEEDDDIVESDVELDNNGVVEPDNNSPQKVSDHPTIFT